MKAVRMMVDWRDDFAARNLSSLITPNVELPLYAACEKLELSDQLEFLDHWLAKWPRELEFPVEESILRPDCEKGKATASSLKGSGGDDQVIYAGDISGSLAIEM